MPAVLEKPVAPKIKFSPEHREIINSYVRARRAEAAAAELKDEVLAIVNLYGGRVVTLNAMLTRGQHVSYVYPKMILRAEEKLRAEKELARITGKADKQVKDCLQFADLLKK